MVSRVERSVATPLGVAVVCCLVGTSLRASSSGDELRQRIEVHRRTIQEKRAAMIQLVEEAEKAHDAIDRSADREAAAASAVKETAAQIVAARKRAQLANAEAQAVQRRVREQLDRVPEVAEASARFERADQARQRALDDVLEPVRSSPPYQAARAKLDAIEKEKAEYLRRARGNPDPDRVSLFLAERRTVEVQIKQMETDAVAANPEVEQARHNARVASDKLQLLRDRHLRQLRESPESQDAARAVTDARRGLTDRTRDAANARRDLATAKQGSRAARARLADCQRRIKQTEREIELLEGAVTQLERKIDRR